MDVVAALTLRTLTRPDVPEAPIPTETATAYPEASTASNLPLPEREVMQLVHRQMFLLAGPGPDLDDLIQTALEQLLSAGFEGRSSFKTFSHAVCFRVWHKHLRSRYRFFARFFISDTLFEVADDQMSVEASLEERERTARLYAALDRISPKRRAVLTLADLSGLSTAEIATIVGASEPTVRSRLRDARRQLEGLLKDDAYFGGGQPVAGNPEEEVQHGGD
jgi:RNA polymerase sigma factor (sigma-70 family)